MPTYDYKCRQCDSTASLVTSIREELQTPICAACKCEMVRDYGTVTVGFNGPGFYTTEK